MDDHDYSMKPLQHYVSLIDHPCLKSPETVEPKVSNTNCCVPLCNTIGYPTLENGHKISYHKFPRDNDGKKLWLSKIKREEKLGFRVTLRTVVCSLHFEEDDYEHRPWSKVRMLKKGAFPSLFPCWNDTPHMKKIKTRARNKLQESRDKSRTLQKAIADIESEDSHEKDHAFLNTQNENCPLETEVEVAANSGVPIESNLEVSHIFEMCTHSCDNDLLSAQNSNLKDTVDILRQQIKDLETHLENCKTKLKDSRFSVDTVNEKELKFYTGFHNRQVFDYVLKFLDPGENGDNICLKSRHESGDEETDTKRGRRRKLSPKDQFFMFLCRVRAGLLETDLSCRFGVSIGTVSNIIITWANFLYFRLGNLNIWPTRDQVDQFMPESFKEKYPSTRVIIDCTEIKIEMPSSMMIKSQTYSNYKSANTLKGLIGITPGGAVSFVSQLYTGSISDKEITERSGFLQLPFKCGDSVMADKGFENIRPLLPVGVTFNIPPFLGKAGQFSAAEVYETQCIAAERIHVERAIRKIKEFHIFDQIIPLTLAGSVNQIWTDCALLTLFQSPIISQ